HKEGARRPPRSQWSCGHSGHCPETLQRGAIGTLPKLLERSVPDLTDSLARYPKQHTDLLQCSFLALIEAVVQVEDLPLSFGEVLLEHSLEELAACLRLDLLLDLLGFGASEAFTERGRITVATIERSVERELAG